MISIFWNIISGNLNLDNNFERYYYINEFLEDLYRKKERKRKFKKNTEINE